MIYIIFIVVKLFSNPLRPVDGGEVNLEEATLIKIDTSYEKMIVLKNAILICGLINCESHLYVRKL